MIEISQYNSSEQTQWDDFCDSAKNATMLHKRGYMDYHSDRFSDFSLVATDGNGKIVAMLPACRQGNTVISHAGLTYGGWLLPLRHFDTTTMLEVMDAAVLFLRGQNVNELIYKPVPHIYHTYPAEEDIYALFRHNARMTACNISTVIPLNAPLQPDRGSKSAASAAARNGVTVDTETSFTAEIDEFWSVLSTLLHDRYDTAPVHSIAEIKLLHSRFSGNIKLITAKMQGETVAGVLLFVTAGVAHCQYIAASPAGKQAKAHALMFHRAIEWARNQGLRYFDFGTSNEAGGRVLNEGLIQQKSRLGGRGIAYPTFSVSI
ncbi:MAG: GNAT family N-acetyltransferase [Muribaculaceae bacterium]|nr:GNAT family N-acetyltransferase [Muribaculaceae bacterium]